MRTTLDIADDVLFAAKEIARREKRTLGETISDLARRAFATAASEQTSASGVSKQLASYGVFPLASRGGMVTNELIDRIRDEEGI